MSPFSFRGRSSNVRGIGANVKATREGSFGGSVSTGVSIGDSKMVLPAPPVLDALSESVMARLAKTGGLETVLAERGALWRAYYASCQSVVRASCGGSGVSSTYGVSVCSEEMKEKFARLGALRRSVSTLSNTSSAFSGLVPPVFAAGVFTAPGDYALDADVCRFGEGACYLRLMRKGYVAEVFGQLGVWPSMAALLDLPGRCYIQPAGLQFRMCTLVGDRIHVDEGCGGTSFVDVLAQLRESGLVLPRWAAVAVRDFPGVGRLRTVTPTTLIGGRLVQDAEVFKTSVRAGESLVAPSVVTGIASGFDGVLSHGDDAIIPVFAGESHSDVVCVDDADKSGSVYVDGCLVFVDDAASKVKELLALDVDVAWFDHDAFEFLVTGKPVRVIAAAVEKRSWDYLIKVDGVHVKPVYDSTYPENTRVLSRSAVGNVLVEGRVVATGNVPALVQDIVGDVIVERRSGNLHPWVMSGIASDAAVRVMLRFGWAFSVEDACVAFDPSVPTLG